MTLGGRVRRGFFLTLEGIDGAGKSTLAKTAAELLRTRYPDVRCTREPGGTPLGEALRRLFLEERGLPIGARAECLLFSAARAQHLEDVIEPALEAGTAVICDRYVDSTLAYQGAGRGLSRERVEALQNWLAPSWRPDLSVLLDLPVEEGRRRGQARATPPNRFEDEQRTFHEAVRKCYLELAAAEPERIRVLDASRPLPEVLEALRVVLEAAMPEAEAGP